MNKLNYFKVLAAACLSFTLTACGSDWKQDHTISFYHWKSTYNVDDEVRKVTKDLDCEKVYIHLFDVVKDGQTVKPVDQIAPIEKNVLNDDSVKFVPVVFIMNEVFVDMPEDEINSLAIHVNSLVSSICYSGLHINDSYKELQIDCDWTMKTKDKYFKFLECLKECNKHRILSSTIRLHQVKDVKDMGVPPVGKGYLMCYATSDPRDGEKSNSILDINLLKNYTANLETYPLVLDYALPLYSWGIVTNHKGKVKLINGLSRNDVENDGFEKLSDNTYKVLDDCFINGLYLNKDFVIEIEEITPKLLREAKVYLDEKLGKNYNIVYYHLSKGFLKRFTIKDLN